VSIVALYRREAQFLNYGLQRTPLRDVSTKPITILTMIPAIARSQG